MLFRSGQLLRTFVGHSDAVNSVVFSPDGERVLSGSSDFTMKLWDAASGRELRTLTGHGGIVSAVAFSPDGRTIISGSFDGTIKIWNAQTGDLVVTMIGGRDEEWLTITPEGFFAASNNGLKSSEYVSVVRDLEAYSVRQFYDHLYRPDLVAEALKGDPVGKVKDAAFMLSLKKILNSGSAPQIELLKDRTETSGDTVKLTVRIKDAGGGIGGKVVWRVNGKTQGNLTVPGLQGPPSIGRAVSMTQELKVIASEKNIIEVTAYNGADLLASLPFTITVDPFGVATQERPKLYMLADRKSTRLNSSHIQKSRMPSSA